VGSGLAAVAIVAAAVSWTLLGDGRPSSPVSPAGAGDTPWPAVTEPEPSLEPLTITTRPEPSGEPATPDTSAGPRPSADPGTTKDAKPAESDEPTPAQGVLAGGIVHLGGPSPGQTSAPGYRPGTVELYTDKGRRVAARRVDERGYRFSLAPGGYRLQTAVGDRKCWTVTNVKPGRTTRADLKCDLRQVQPDPVFLTAAIKDASGDVKDPANAGTTPPYADLLLAATNVVTDGVMIEFTTAGAIPSAAPADGQSRSQWTASIEQGGTTAILTITATKGAWTVRWAAKNPESGLPDATDQATAAARPVISGPRVSAALGRGAPLKTAAIDFTKPYRIVGASSHVILSPHAWTDTTP
jgi:hypothetical protein